MARMVRKQVYIEAEQDALLKERSRELGVTEAELIRRAIGGTGAAPGTFIDKQAWREELAFIQERAKLPVHGHSRTWTRDELYEDRIGRFSR